MKASSQKGSRGLGGSSGNTTASTNSTSSTLAVAATSDANPWRSLLERDPCTNRPQARGSPEPRAPGARLMRFLSWRLKPKAAAAPNSGRGAGTGATWAHTHDVEVFVP